MQNDYYQNIVYPFQDKVLEVINKLDIDLLLKNIYKIKDAK